MSELPKVSVVVATRNRAKSLREMLDGLFQSDYANMEVVVVDGDSSDGTKDVLRSYGDKIARWVSEPDDGEFFAYNKALRLATGSIIKLMTDDDLLRPQAISAAVLRFLSDPGLDILFGQTAGWQKKGAHFVKSWETVMLDPGRLDLRHWLREKQAVCSVAAFIRRRVFEQVGCLSTQYACGDIEFWARAAFAGVRFGVMRDVIVDYRRTAVSSCVVKRWRLKADIIRVNARWGTSADVLASVFRKYVSDEIARGCVALHIHPLRKLRRWFRSEPAVVRRMD